MDGDEFNGFDSPLGEGIFVLGVVLDVFVNGLLGGGVAMLEIEVAESISTIAKV